METIKTEYINENGETLKLGLDTDGDMIFNHSDIHDNDDMQKFVDGKHIFDEKEIMIIRLFHLMADTIKL